MFCLVNFHYVGQPFWAFHRRQLMARFSLAFLLCFLRSNVKTLDRLTQHTIFNVQPLSRFESVVSHPTCNFSARGEDMAIMSRFHRIVGNKSAETEATSVDDPIALQVRADDKEAAHAAIDDATGKEEARPDEDAQAGVQKIEAVTLAWGKGSMLMVLILYVCLLLLHSLILANQLAHTDLFE